MPKGLAINLNIIIGVIIFAMAAILAIWVFFPALLEPVITLPGSQVAVSWQYWPDTKPDSSWTVNATVLNQGSETIENIILEVPDDDVVTGATVVVDSLPSAQQKTVFLLAKIKEDAPAGKHKVSLRTIVPGAQTKIDTVEIEIKGI